MFFRTLFQEIWIYVIFRLFLINFENSMQYGTLTPFILIPLPLPKPPRSFFYLTFFLLLLNFNKIDKVIRCYKGVLSILLSFRDQWVSRSWGLMNILKEFLGVKRNRRSLLGGFEEFWEVLRSFSKFQKVPGSFKEF